MQRVDQAPHRATTPVQSCSVSHGSKYELISSTKKPAARSSRVSTLSSSRCIARIRSPVSSTWWATQHASCTRRAPSDQGSDFYEELLVNPALLTLARQRGDLDCGGLRHLVIAYGNFNQVVLPLPDGTGHLSVCLERDADADGVAAQLREILMSLSAT